MLHREASSRSSVTLLYAAECIIGVFNHQVTQIVPSTTATLADRLNNVSFWVMAPC